MQISLFICNTLQRTQVNVQQQKKASTINKNSDTRTNVSRDFHNYVGLLIRYTWLDILLFYYNHPYPKSFFLFRLQIIIERLQGLTETPEEQVLLYQLVYILYVRHFPSNFFEMLLVCTSLQLHIVILRPSWFPTGSTYNSNTPSGCRIANRKSYNRKRESSYRPKFLEQSKYLFKEKLIIIKR